MRTIVRLLWAMLSLVSFAGPAFGDITVTSPFGAAHGTISNLVIVGNSSAGWGVSFTAAVQNRSAGADPIQVYVKAHQAGETILYVRVTTSPSPDPNDYVVVSVFPDEASDSIPTLYEITKSGGNADLIVNATSIGQLGTPYRQR